MPFINLRKNYKKYNSLQCGKSIVYNWQISEWSIHQAESGYNTVAVFCNDAQCVYSSFHCCSKFLASQAKFKL